MVIAAAEEAAAGQDLDELVGGLERPHRPDPGLRRGRRPRVPPAGRPHRRRPGPVGLAPLDKAGHRGQRRRGGRGVQAAHPGPRPELPHRQGGRRRPPRAPGRRRRGLRRHRRGGRPACRSHPGAAPAGCRSSSVRWWARTPVPNTVGVCYIVPAGHDRARPTTNLCRWPNTTSRRAVNRALDTIDTVVATVNDKAIRPAIVAARAVVFGVIIGVIALAVVVILLSVGLIRLAHGLPLRPPGVDLLPGAGRHLLPRPGPSPTPARASPRHVMTERRKVVIIGSGPAGLTAAIYCRPGPARAPGH